MLSALAKVIIYITFFYSPVIWQQIWQYLQTVATFLLEVGNDLQQRLQQSSTEDVQEILIDILRPYGIPNSAIEGSHVH